MVYIVLREPPAVTVHVFCQTHGIFRPSLPDRLHEHLLFLKTVPVGGIVVFLFFMQNETDLFLPGPVLVVRNDVADLYKLFVFGGAVIYDHACKIYHIAYLGKSKCGKRIISVVLYPVTFVHE